MAVLRNSANAGGGLASYTVVASAGCWHCAVGSLSVAGAGCWPGFNRDGVAFVCIQALPVLIWLYTGLAGADRWPE